jgi:hypothetical protein
MIVDVVVVVVVVEGAHEEHAGGGDVLDVARVVGLTVVEDDLEPDLVALGAAEICHGTPIVPPRGVRRHMRAVA